jgi:hypothetical protein
VRVAGGLPCRRIIGQGAGRGAGGREGWESSSGLGMGGPQETVEKGAQLSARIKSTWHETVSVVEDGSGDLASGYTCAASCVGFIVGGPSHMLYIV